MSRPVKLISRGFHSTISAPLLSTPEKPTTFFFPPEPLPLLPRSSYRLSAMPTSKRMPSISRRGQKPEGSVTTTLSFRFQRLSGINLRCRSPEISLTPTTIIPMISKTEAHPTAPIAKIQCSIPDMANSTPPGNRQ